MPLDVDATVQTARKLLSSERYLDIGIGLSLPPKRTTVPTLIFSGQLKTRGSPNAQVEPYPIFVLADPKLILKHFRRMRELKPFQDANSVNNTVSVPLSFDVKRLFSPDWKPGHLRSAYAKICSLKFKPPHLGEDPYFAQILGHTLNPGRAPSYSVRPEL